MVAAPGKTLAQGNNVQAIRIALRETVPVTRVDWAVEHTIRGALGVYRRISSQVGLVRQCVALAAL